MHTLQNQFLNITKKMADFPLKASQHLDKYFVYLPFYVTDLKVMDWRQKDTTRSDIYVRG